MRRPVRTWAASHSVVRVQSLSDGVFSIAMTLLVLNIHLPNSILESASSGDLGLTLVAVWENMWPTLLGYLLSFAVLGVFWIAYHFQFHYITRSNRTHVWINIIFLMTVGLIPFSAGLLGTHGDKQVSVVIYGINMMLSGLMLSLHWWYATSNHRLVSASINPVLVRMFMQRALLGPLIMLLAIALSFVGAAWSFVVYMAVPVLYILPEKIDNYITDPPDEQR